MLRREVLQCRAGPDGAVLALGNRGESWSPRAADLVIADIRDGRCSYVVPSLDGDWPVLVSGAGELTCPGLRLAALPRC